MRKFLKEKRVKRLKLQSMHWLLLRTTGLMFTRTDDHVKWTAPDENLLKINVDRAFAENGAGIGLVVRKHPGQIAAVMAERLFGALSAEHVQCLAFFKALQFTRDFGISHFILEGDALSIVQRINS